MKKSAIILSAVTLLVSVLAIQSCQKPQETEFSKRVLELPEENLNYEVPIPGHISWNQSIPFNTTNVDAKATLGRVLFYDTRLSFNNTTSCASCHEAHLGYADNEASSQGLHGLGTRRNAPGIANLAFDNEFFWDGRRNDLEQMVLDPVQDHVEMGLSDLDVVLDRLIETEDYQALYADAYYNLPITEDRIRESLATFIRSMVSYDSRYDRHLMGTGNLNGQELFGLELFEQNCMSCHSGHSLGGWGAANIGLESEYEDEGVGEWMNDPSASGRFVIPGLRNVAETAPYMHDGRFESLEEVLDHYSEGIVLHDHLDYRLIDPETFSGGGEFGFPFNGGSWADTGAEPRRMNFSGPERDALIAFLEALSDQTHMTAERFSDPFVLVD